MIIYLNIIYKIELNNKLFFIYFNKYFLSIIIIKKQIHL